MPKYTDQQIRTIIETADPTGLKVLACGRNVYLSLPAAEQAVVNTSLRRIMDCVPKVGPVLALEIYTAAVLKQTRIEATYAVH